MKKIITLLITLTLLTSAVNAQINPNAHLGLDKDWVEHLCESSFDKSLLLPNIKNLTSFEEGLYLLQIDNEKVAELLDMLDNQSLPLPYESQEEIGKLWNAKYNQIYCPDYFYGGLSGAYLAESYLDIRLLITKQFNVLEKFYGKGSPYQFNINRVVKKDPTKKQSEWVTFADLVKDLMDENPNIQQKNKEALQKYYTIITSEWGGKHFNELTDAEKSAAGIDLDKEKSDDAEAKKVEAFFQLIEDNLKGKKVIISAPYSANKVFYIDRDGNIQPEKEENAINAPIYMEAEYKTIRGDRIVKLKRRETEQHRLLLKTIYSWGADNQYYITQTATGTNLQRKEDFGRDLTIEITHKNGVINKVKYVYYAKTRNYTVKYEPWSGSIEYPLAALKSYEALYQYPKNWEDTRLRKSMDFAKMPKSDFKILKPITYDYSSRYGRYENDFAYLVISENKMVGGLLSKPKKNNTGTVKEQIISDLNPTMGYWEYVLEEHVIYHVYPDISPIIDHYMNSWMIDGDACCYERITYKPNGDISLWETTFKKIR